MTDAPAYDGPVMKTAPQIAELYGVQTFTVWAWARRGHITSHAGMYDLREVDAWYHNQRDDRMDAIRQGEKQLEPLGASRQVGTTTAKAAERMGIDPRTLRKWVERGHVRRYGRDRYDAGDVAARWMKLARDGYFFDETSQSTGEPH